MSKSPPYPFLKWLGGKQRVRGHILSRLPTFSNVYYEPMVGAGAVFLEMARAKRFGRAVIGDANPELMRAWRCVRDDVDGLVDALRDRRYKYGKDEFLAARALNPVSMSDVEASARFIYLNRTCFNGLYRVNKDGQFNTPFGRYSNPLVCDEPNLRSVSEVLQSVDIRTADFRDTLDSVRLVDVPVSVYADPPYFPVSSTANFTSYTEDGFGPAQQERLAARLSELAAGGVRVVVSNSAAPAAMALYGGRFDVDEIRGSRSVGGSTSSRRAVREIIAFAGPRS